MGAKRLIALSVAVAVLAAASAGCRDEGSPAILIASDLGVVARVDDGDTITLRAGERVRLLQIDAPELTQDCYGRAAKRALQRHLDPGTQAQLLRDPGLDEHDRYGRLLRYVVVGGENVNVALVREGAASPYFFRGDRGIYARELLDAVYEARDAATGAPARPPSSTRVSAP